MKCEADPNRETSNGYMILSVTTTNGESDRDEVRWMVVLYRDTK